VCRRVVVVIMVYPANAGPASVAAA
jgi:hypothetical protein